MSFTTACADGLECFAFIFVPYSHYDEPKTLTYFMQPICLLNADGGHISQSDKGGIVMGGDPDNWPSYAQRGNPMITEGAIAQAIALIPALSRLRMLRTWSGVTDMSFDGSPIIGKTPVPNLFLNGGWCYGGFKGTPASGYTFAHTLAEGEPHPLNAPFDLDRFRRGDTIDENGVGPMPNHR